MAREAQQGDRHALDQLVRAIQADVWRYCAHLVGRADADDVAQDALVRIIAKLHRWERGPVLAWALGVARNVCLEHHRRSRRSLSADEIPLAAADQLGAVEVLQMLSGLPTEMREAIVLTQIIGLSYAEAAEVARCPIGTIRSRVARARDTVATSLGSARHRAT